MRVRIFNRTDLSHALKDFIIDNEDITLLNFLENGLNSEVSKRFKRCVTVLCDGVEIPHNIWSKYNLKSTQNITFIIKPQDVFSIAMIIIALAVAVYTMVMMKKLKTNDKKQESGSSIYDPNAQGNKAKLEDPIPEQFGLVKAFPDYISDKHYFYVNNVRYMSMLLCQGVGYYDWSLNQMYIGATPISSYVGSDIDVLVADPDQDISSHDAHRCWYNSTEVTSVGKEVPATETSSRKTGALSDVTLTLSGLNASSSSNLGLVSGDIIRLYNLQGQDRTINLTSIEMMVSSVRCYAQSIPNNLNLALGWAVNLTVVNGGSSETYPLKLVNYGTDTQKGSFIDVSFVELDIDENTTATLVLKDFVYNDSNLDSTHVLDDGYYEVQAVNGSTYTLLAVDKSGITYVNTQNWSGFSQNRTTTATVELVDTGRFKSNAKTNVAGYYRACPVGATSRYYEVDFNFPSGLYHMSDEGDYESRTATILLEWRIAGSADTPQSLTKVYTKSSPDAFGETISIDVGNDLNAYEFRVTNMSDYSDDSQDMQTFMWNGLKCLISSDTHYPDVTVIAITVRGSESLSELGDNQISTLWTRRLASLKDVKTRTYSNVQVQGTDKFSYGGIELFNEIMNNLQYPAYWKYPQNFMYIVPTSETYHKRDLCLDSWKTADDNSGGFSKNGANVWYTNQRLMQKRDKTIIQFVMCVACPNYYNLSVDSAYINSHRDQLDYSNGNSYNLNHQIFFECDNYSERGELGRSYNGFCLCMYDAYKPSNYSQTGVSPYIQFRLYNTVNGNETGQGVHVASYMQECFTSGTDDTFVIRIEHTRSYIKVWFDNEHLNSDDISESGTLMLNVTADQYPQIATQFGQYIGFVKGVTYGSGGYNWKWYFSKLTVEYPTMKTVRVANQSATVEEDKEVNRSLSAPIKYICESSKFGKIYDEQNLMQLDQMWHNGGINFDYRFDKSTTVLEAVKQIMQIGYCEPIIDGNKIKGVYRSADKYVEQLFTSANMTGDPKITYNFVTPTDNDEVDITYMDPTNWKQNAIYADIDKSDNSVSVYNYQNSLNTEKVEVLAVTDVNKALKLGVRRLREVLYQRKQIDFDCEFDALNCNYGSLIAVALPQDMNTYNGYVTHYDSQTYTITVSDKVPEDVTIIYIRRYDGSIQQLSCTYISDYSIQLLAPLDFEWSDNPQYDLPHYAIGKVEKYWVTSIKPSDKKCSVTAINYDARVFVDDQIEPEPEPEPETTITIDIDVANQTITSSDPENVTVPTNYFDIVTFDGKSCIRANSSYYATFVFGENIESFTCKIFLQSVADFTLFVEVNSANNTMYSLVYYPYGTWWNPDRAVFDRNNVLVGVWVTVTYSNTNKTLTFDNGTTQLTRSLDNYLVNLSIGSFANRYNIYLTDLEFEVSIPSSKYLNGTGLSEVWANTKNYISAQLLGKSNVGHTHSASDITDLETWNYDSSSNAIIVSGGTDTWSYDSQSDSIIVS